MDPGMFDDVIRTAFIAIIVCILTAFGLGFLARWIFFS